MLLEGEVTAKRDKISEKRRFNGKLTATAGYPWFNGEKVVHVLLQAKTCTEVQNCHVKGMEHFHILQCSLKASRLQVENTCFCKL